MRAMLTMAAAALLSTGLASCNQAPQASAPAPIVAAAPAAPPPPQQIVSTAPVAVARHRRHRHSSRSQESYSSESYGESSGSASSGVSYGSVPYGDEEAAASTVPAQAQAAVWIDGYGRGHYVAAGMSADNANPAALTAQEVRKRLAPWHAYDSKCAARAE